jgi:hypothetical protein
MIYFNILAVLKFDDGYPALYHRIAKRFIS